MLSYFKYFALMAFILVSFFAYFTGGYLKKIVLNDFVVRTVEESNVIFAKNYEQKVWCRYVPALKKVYEKGSKEWKNDKFFNSFVKLSKTVIATSPAAKISIFNIDGVNILSTNDLDFIFFDDSVNDEISFVQSNIGTIKSEYVDNVAYNLSDDFVKDSFARTIVPISSANCGGVDDSLADVNANIVIYSKIHLDAKQLLTFQLYITFGIIMLFILLYLVMYFTSRKAEQIINKQHEEKILLEKAKTRAESENQEKSMFLANVSHELRTPLNAIIGFSEIIKDEVMGAVGHPQYKEYINDINSSGVHLLSLINDILDYSKAEARKLEVEHVEVDLTKISQSCLRLVEPRANQSNIKLVARVPEKHIILNADPKRMKQIILNILSNSVKFTPENGEIVLTIEEDPLDNKVRIIITDTGIGISAKDISKALSPFGQIDSSISRKYEGTGLGLPLTKQLTDIMGGTFEITSEVGLGTTITLIFPLHSEKEADDGGEAKF